MARVIIADSFGPPENYQIRDHDVPPPGEGEIQVSIKAIGISYVDVLTAMGKYQVTPPLPFIPGSECAGVVTAIGEGVSGHNIGDNVMGSGFGGVFAETANFRASSFSKIPAGLSIEQAAVFPPSYLTATHALIDRGRLQPDETLLVLGAGGATGIATIQVGKAIGARVIASASSAEKRAICLEAGADVAVNTQSETWRDDVKAANYGKGVNVVFDPVGGKLTDPAFRSLGYDGRHLVVGFTGGIATLRTNLPLVKTSSLIGVQLRVFGMEEPEQMARTRARMMELATAGKLQPVIGRVYAFDDYENAMNDAFAGKTAGRIVLKV